MIESQHYDELLARESRHWGSVVHDPENPQIWHDPALFEVFFGREFRHFLDCAVRSGPRILELGSGEGKLALELASRGMRITGVDLSDERVRRAAAVAQGLGLETPPSFAVADLNTLELPEETFDCVVAHDSLHHILHLSRLCHEVRKSLKPGGSFLVMDYIGMGMLRKIIAGALYAVLPTYQPYSKKWKLRKRLGSYLASEEEKRAALENSSTGALHSESPFEEISQRSIIPEIRKRFDIVELKTYCPFWFYFAAKVRVPSSRKRIFARTLRAMDDLITNVHLSEGAYVWINARKPSSTN